MTTDRPTRLLTVCTYNRTRSVMMAALLGRALDDRLGAGAVEIGSTGFVQAGVPPIDAAVEAMARRGLDVSTHLSSVASQPSVDVADLILTAERDHVVRVAALSPPAFRRAVTLPELLDRVTDPSVPAAPTDVPDMRAWVQALTAGRTAQGFLRQPVPEVADPTGASSREFERAVAELEAQCNEAADAIARAITVR